MFCISCLRIHKDKSFHCEVCNVCLDKRLEGKHKCRPDSGHDECCICLEVSGYCIVTFAPLETYFSGICNSHLQSSHFLTARYPRFPAIENSRFPASGNSRFHIIENSCFPAIGNPHFPAIENSRFPAIDNPCFPATCDSHFPVNYSFCHT